MRPRIALGDHVRLRHTGANQAVVPYRLAGTWVRIAALRGDDAFATSDRRLLRHNDIDAVERGGLLLVQRAGGFWPDGSVAG